MSDKTLGRQLEFVKEANSHHAEQSDVVILPSYEDPQTPISASAADFGLNESAGDQGNLPTQKGHVSPDPLESFFSSEPPRAVVGETKTCVQCQSNKRTEGNVIDMSVYNELLSKYDNLLVEYEKSMKEASELKIRLLKLPTRRPQELPERNALLQKEIDELRSQISHMETEGESLRQRCASLEEANQQLRNQVEQAQVQPHKIEDANIATERVEKPPPVRTGSGQLRRRGRQNPIEELINRTQIYLDPTIGGHAKENNLLATQMALMTNPKPKYTETYYCNQFDQLNNESEIWIVSQVNSTSPGALSKIYRKEETRYPSLVSKVKDLDEIAGKTLEMQKAELLSDPDNRRKYIALIRHVIAVFLHSQILRLFTFGLDPKEADGLSRVEKEICTNGFELSLVQQVHQCVGLEAMKCRTSKELGARKKAVTSILVSLLQKLLVPTRSRDAKIKSFAASIVDKAIKLRDQMTEEREVYRCTLPYHGESFNEDLHQLGSPSRESGGDIQLCAFPGLTRLTTFNPPTRGPFAASVVKARVIRNIEWKTWGGC